MDVAFRSEHTFVCGHGAYRHVAYFELEQGDVASILLLVKAHLQSDGHPSANLHNVYEALKPSLEIDYYELRHLVREFGESQGLHFDGHSSSDSVALTPEFSRVGGEETVLRILTNSPTALTVAEVAQKTRSKNISLVTQQLGTLRERNEAVRTDRMMYTTPAKAFAGVDVRSIGEAMDDVIQASDRIIEADIFREHLNPSLGESYSKHFYVGAMHYVAESYEWSCSNTLVSREPLPARNIQALLRLWLDWNEDAKSNEMAVRTKLWLTNHMIASSVRSWIRALLDAGPSKIEN